KTKMKRQNRRWKRLSRSRRPRLTCLCAKGCRGYGQTTMPTWWRVSRRPVGNGSPQHIKRQPEIQNQILGKARCSLCRNIYSNRCLRFYTLETQADPHHAVHAEAAQFPDLLAPPSEILRDHLGMALGDPPVCRPQPAGFHAEGPFR